MREGETTLKFTCSKRFLNVCYYLVQALKHQVENGVELAAILEDNIAFNGDVSHAIHRYMAELQQPQTTSHARPWDLLFDSGQMIMNVRVPVWDHTVSGVRGQGYNLALRPDLRFMEPAA